MVYENIQSEDNFNFNTFTEITPLDQEIENIPRKDLYLQFQYQILISQKCLYDC